MKDKFTILELAIWGSKEVFSSTDKKETALKLIEIGAYQQPIMMDGGYMLVNDGQSYNIDKFVEKFK